MLRLHTLGGTGLRADGQPVAGPMTQRRRLALLALLASAGDRGVSRDKLVGLLWPESEAGKARHSLSQWLFLLRRDLPPGALLGTDDLRLDPAIVASDVAEFGHALAHEELERAVALYGGPFLDGFFLPGASGFERWVEVERTTLAHRWQGAAEALARRAPAEGSPESAAALWRRLAASDPPNGRLAVELMRALDRAGDRAGALAHARVHSALLREQYQLPPDRDVEALAWSLQHAPVPSPVSSPVSSPVQSPVAPVPVPGANGARDTEPPPAADDIVLASGDPFPGGGAGGGRRRSVVGHRAARAAVGAVIAVAVLGLTVLALLPPDRRATLLVVLERDAPTLDPRRVVVAPLENATGDTALTGFGEMAADWTAQALARTAAFEVVDARTASMTARVIDRLPRLLRSRDDAVALARETGAGTVVWGSYYRDHDTLRVLVHLTDAASGRRLRSLTPVAGPVASLTPIVEAVSRRAAGLLAAAIDTTPAGLGIGQAPPPSFEAYRETGRAWESYYVSDYRGAFEHTGRAARLDSAFMLPLVMQAFFHAEWREWGAVDSLVRVVERRAGALAPLELAGFELVRAELRGDLSAQLRAAHELARLAPGSVEARVHVAHVAVMNNRPDEALVALAALDPARGVLLVAPFWHSWTAASRHMLGDHARELAVAREAVRRFPTRNVSLLNLARALGAAGLAGEVRALARRATTERWDAAAVRRRALVEGSRELRAHGHPGPAAELLAEALALLAAARDSSPAALEARAILLAEAGRLDEARSALAAWRARATAGAATNDLAATGLAGVLAARSGDARGAAWADSALAATRASFPRGRHTLWRARIAAAHGDRNRVTELLQQAMAEGYPVMHGHAAARGAGAREFDYAETLVHADPAFDALRDDPAFRRLLEPRG